MSGGWYNLSQTFNRDVTEPENYSMKCTNSHFLSQDYFDMVNPPEHRPPETEWEMEFKKEKKNTSTEQMHIWEWLKKTKWFVTEVQAFKL